MVKIVDVKVAKEERVVMLPTRMALISYVQGLLVVCL